jgi:hypothetical protein
MNWLRIQQAGKRNERADRRKAPGGKDWTATGDLPFFRWRVYGAREASQGSALRSDRYAAQKNAALTNLPLRPVLLPAIEKM